MAAPLRVGLVGAGPWARAVTGPVFGTGSGSTLSGVWSRTASRARECADHLGTTAFDDLDALIDASDAVAIAVPPAAQPDLAVRAARAGRPLLVEKPLGVTVADAVRVVDAVEDAGIPTLITLTNRFHADFDPFVREARSMPALGGRGCFLSGAHLPGSPYAQGWRLEHGALLDVGPHLLDLLDAALGPVTEVRAAGDPHGWVALTLAHESGATSQASLCCRAAIGSRTEVEVFGPRGSVAFDGRTGERAAIGRVLGDTFVRVARGELRHPADARRGLALQRYLDAALRSLRSGAPARPGG